MRKVISIIMILFILSGCFFNAKDDKYDGLTYINLLKEFEVRTKNIENNVDNKDFNELLDEVFIDSLSYDYMTMHYSVVDYKKYGIQKPEVNLGTIEYALDEESFNYYLDLLSRLEEFDFSKLSYSQQYDYEALKYSIYETLASLCYYKYNLIFSSSNCLPMNLLSNFEDYTFYNTESIDDYLVCLEDVDRYIDDMIIYTESQSEDKIYTLDESLDYTIDVCENFVSKVDDNSLIISFNKRLNNLDYISDNQKQDYININTKIIKEEVIPAYQKLADVLENYYGKANTSKSALCNIDKGYAEYVYLLSGSNNYSIDETFEILKDTLDYFESVYISVAYDIDLYNKYSNIISGDNKNLFLTGKEALEYLKNNVYTYYPELGDVEYTVEELDPTIAPDSVVAYYWPSPIDDTNQNIIRTNPNNMEEGINTFMTLSHEGFPGHLYQTIFYLKTNPHNFRQSISFIGYTEGYAVMASKDAFNYSIDNEILADTIFFEQTNYFILYSLIDIGVNYYGWSINDIVKYFRDNSRLFSFDNTDAESFRNFIIEKAGVYTSYGIGFSRLLELRNSTQKQMGDKFNIVEYNKQILKNGPLPFSILNEAINEYSCGK